MSNLHQLFKLSILVISILSISDIASPPNSAPGAFTLTSQGFLTRGNLTSYSGDFYYHFDGSSKFSDMHPWDGTKVRELVFMLDQDIILCHLLIHVTFSDFKYDNTTL